jgi:16S rRNA (guanine(966)-N(2))-methyltransferase RsmD
MIREAVFNMLGPVVEDMHVLDVCAGSGAVGFEAISRGARSCVFIENEKTALQAIRKNISSLHLEKECSLIADDAVHALKRLEKKAASFSLIYVDPPYSLRTKSDLLIQIAHVLNDARTLVASGAYIFFEDSAQSILDGVEFSHLRLQMKRRYGDSCIFLYLKNESIRNNIF